MRQSKDLAVPGHRPPGVVSVRDILDGKCTKGAFVNTIGLVIDTQAPRATRGADWKCTMRLIDRSVDGEGDNESITCNFFMQEEDMPQTRCGDVLVLHQARVQHRDSDISLITHLSTRFSLFTAGKIPAPPADASVARASTAVRKQKPLSKTELEYVSFLYHNTNKDRIPTAEKYETTMVQSRNVREKFRVLKDVTEGLFCDLVVHIVRAPYDEGNKMTFWVSDYTENQAFYNFSVNATDSMWFEDGDRYGYLAKSGKKSAENRGDEEGPYGKRSMQITCWEPHASAIRESSISKGTWVLMKNVHIKYGRNASNLEGYLREDLGAYGVKIGIFALDSTDRESMDPRHLQALKRHRDYDRARRSQLKEIGEAAKAGQKRKSQGVAEEQTPASNSTSRRKARRKAKERAAQKAPDEQNGAEELEVVGVAPTPNLNSSVKCENHKVPPSRVSEILKRVIVETDILGEAVHLPLPFVNVNHRVDVRVTDFRPSNLTSFAYPKKSSKFDVLSDNEDSDLDSESDNDMMMEFTAEREWEWRFALQLEDATVDAEPRERFWVAIDNQAAQCLTNLDASNLKHDAKNLEALRKQMFFLWGNLEEQKRAGGAKLAQAKRAGNSSQPPPDSSDDEAEEQAVDKAAKVTNRPFSCCVRQYGIKVRENDPSKADADNGYRWVRIFGLYGTRIAAA